MLFHCVDESIELSPEQAAEVEESTLAWTEQTTHNGVNLGGDHLAAVRGAASVRVRGGKLSRAR
jgi:hypothetical protein